MPTASAVPAALIGYGDHAAAIDDELQTKATATADEVDAFKASRPDYGSGVDNPGPSVGAYAKRNRTADDWVRRVGQAFHRADHRGWFGWVRALFAKPATHAVTMDDADPRLDGAGWPSEEQAAEAGRRFTNDIKAHLGDGGDDAAQRLDEWGGYLDRHKQDAAFTAALFATLGVDGTLRIPMLVEHAYPVDAFGHPGWGLEAIRPFSEALGTALSSGRLPNSFADELADYRGSYDDGEPQEYHAGLLFTAPNAAFPADFLVRLADNLVSTPMWRNNRGEPLHITPFGPAIDPVANVLGALGRNQEAATRWLEEPFPDGDTNLELLLHRYANDLDGDGGRNAAATLRAALTNPDLDRSGRLFEQAMAEVNDAGGIRNFFNTDVFADAAAVHIVRLQAIAATEDDGHNGAHARLMTAHDFLERLLADNDAAAKVYDAAVRQVYDIVGHTSQGDTLGSEAWDAGSLLGLILTADRNADIDSTKERIARRQALLDGLREVTDLGLAFVPGGKWLPFVKTGRNHLLDGFAIDGELDHTLEAADAFEGQVRFQLSAIFAVRLAVDRGETPPADPAAFATWVNGSHDLIGPLRTQAGQRMDEVERLLPDRG